jgi:hypothetical protein
VHAHEQALIIKDCDRKLKKSAKRYCIMRTLAKTTLALGFVGAMAIGSTAPVQAQGVYFDARPTVPTNVRSCS